MKIEFEESQKFGQWWLWLILIVVTAIPLYGVYIQLIVGEQFGDNPLSNLGLILFLFSMLLFMWFFWKLELTTKITKE